MENKEIKIELTKEDIDDINLLSGIAEKDSSAVKEEFIELLGSNLFHHVLHLYRLYKREFCRQATESNEDAKTLLDKSEKYADEDLRVLAKKSMTLKEIVRYKVEKNYLLADEEKQFILENLTD